MNLTSIIKTDWPRKAVALLCACLIWYSVHRQISEVQIFRDIPVTLNHKKNLMLLEEDLPKINVTVRGPKRRLNSITTADIKVMGQISDEATRGRYTVLLRSKNIELPRGLEASDIQPNSFQVYVDTKTSKEIPIRCRFSGRLPEGYDRKSVFFVPKNAQISGPSKIIQRIKQINTESIELDETVQDDFEVEVQLETIKNVSISPKSVKVKIELYKLNESKFFGNLEILSIGSRSKDFFVENFIIPKEPKIEAVIGGPKSTIDFLTSSSVRAFIDISNISTSGTYRLPINLWVDAKDCSALEIRPMIAEVKVESRPK